MPMNIQLCPIKLTFTYEKIYTPTNEWAYDLESEPCQEGFIEDCMTEFYDEIMKLEMDQRAQVELLKCPIDIQWESWDEEG